jgi:hypothetical protein
MLLKHNTNYFQINTDMDREKYRSNILHNFCDYSDVVDIWKQCIVYSVEFNNPIFCHTQDGYNSTIDSMKKKILNQKRNVEKGLYQKLAINFNEFENSPYLKQKELAVAYAHEVRMFQIKHRRCSKCQSVSIVKGYTKTRNENDKYQCLQCVRLNVENFWKKNCDVMLPVWYNDDYAVQFHVPKELQNLRLGEQLLIQRLSCFVPIVHIKHGMMGIHGNCVCFRQDITEICNVLPRTKVNAIKIIRSYAGKDSHGIQDIDVFVIRKNVVMNALKWLKKYHKWYRDDPDLIIQESNLDWMGNKEEASLIGSEATSSNLVQERVYDSKMREEDDDNLCGKRLSTKSFLYKLYKMNLLHCSLC